MTRVRETVALWLALLLMAIGGGAAPALAMPQATVPQVQPLPALPAPQSQSQPQSQPTPTPTSMPAPGAVATTATPAGPPLTLNDGYVIGVGDVIEVSVIGRAEYNSRVQVQTDGTIQLPYINNVRAKDRTVLQLRDDVRKLLTAGGYYANPAVNIGIASFSSRYVVVLGEVGAPGIVPVDRAYRVSEILARVGGAKDSGDDVLSLRRENGDELKLPIRRIATGGPADDPVVNPGDKIYIPVAPSFYIYGQVGAPGNYRVSADMTMRMALARAGGMTERGSEKRVKVYRDGKELTHYNLSDPVKGGDTIMVGERFF